MRSGFPYYMYCQPATNPVPKGRQSDIVKVASLMIRMDTTGRRNNPSRDHINTIFHLLGIIYMLQHWWDVLCTRRGLLHSTAATTPVYSYARIHIHLQQCYRPTSSP
jgi:hypothetical protein